MRKILINNSICVYFLYVKLLCKVGEVELMPDAILASIIGCTIWGIIIFDKISTLGIVWF